VADPLPTPSPGDGYYYVTAVTYQGLLVVDDFVPKGSQNDVQRTHREADRLLRAQANASGRGRIRQCEVNVRGWSLQTPLLSYSAQLASFLPVTRGMPTQRRSRERKGL